MAQHRRIVVVVVVVWALLCVVHLTSNNSNEILNHHSLSLVSDVHIATKSKTRGTSHTLSKAETAHFEDSCWKPAGKIQLHMPRCFSFTIPLSYELKVTGDNTCSMGLRFNSMVIPCDNGKFSTLLGFSDMASSRFEFSELQRFAQLITIQGHTPQKKSCACEQTMRQDCLSLAEETFLFNWFPVNTNTSFHVYCFDFLHSPQLPCSFLFESRFPLSDVEQKATPRVLLNSTIALPKPSRLFEDFGYSRRNYFPRFPNLSAIFSYHKNGLNGKSSINSVLLNDAFKEILIVVVCILKIVYTYLHPTEETKNPGKILKRHLKSFSAKGKWEDLTNSLKEAWQRGRPDERKRFYSKSLSRSNSIIETLNEYIFRPWLHKAQPHDGESCVRTSSPNTCASFHSSHCASCQQHLENFTSALSYRESTHVSPATSSFLPNPTLDPAIDLAHVGYRLATLGALPASVPTSRIKLANAGFYFRGQGDEVICYSCGARHSGWRREDSPVDIHRRLSPECSHVLQGVDETAALSRPQSNSIDTPRSAGRETGVRASAQTHNSAPVEDWENPSPPARPVPAETAATRPGTQRPQNHPIPNGCLPVSHASSGSVTESLVVSGSSAAERTPPAATEANRTIPRSHAANGATDTGRPARSASATTNGTTSASGNVTTPRTEAHSGATESRTSTESRTFTDSRPPPGVSSGSHSNHGNTTRSEPRPLFPRAGLDLGGAVYPMYQDMASRRRTFTHWDDSQAPPLDHVILSGMFYAGYADCVRCFYCGVGLKHWVPTDDVWTEHVRWRPGCEYLRAVKGDDFIRETQRRLEIEPHGSSRNRGSGRSDATQSTSRQPTTATPSNTSTTSASARTTAPATTTATTSANSQSLRTEPSTQRVSNSGQTSQTSPAASTTTATATTIGSGQTSQTSSSATAATSGVATTSPGATATSATPSSPRNGRSNHSGRSGSGSNAVVEPSAPEERERLARLQAENRALSRRLQCRVCRQAAINTILMPCGHLVLCETCAGSVTSCPLCHDDIRATAKVHMA